MTAAPPFPPLPENDRVWFAGAAVSAALLAASAKARAQFAGSEWFRAYCEGDDRENCAEPADQPPRAVLDFPPALQASDASRAGEAWEVFRAAGGRLPQGDEAELRIALAKLEQCFIAPARAGRLRWHALDAATLPGRGLLVLARDDEFIAAVSGSHWCEVWRAAQRAGRGRAQLGALRNFPLPWPPATLRSALSREQEERRDAVIRAWRSENDEEINGAVAAAYGWRVTIEDDEALEKLRALHTARLG